MCAKVDLWRRLRCDFTRTQILAQVREFFWLKNVDQFILAVLIAAYILVAKFGVYLTCVAIEENSQSSESHVESIKVKSFRGDNLYKLWFSQRGKSFSLTNHVLLLELGCNKKTMASHNIPQKTLSVKTICER